VFLNGNAIPSRDVRGERIIDDSFYVVLNGHEGDLGFTLPARPEGSRWKKVLDTSQATMAEDDRVFEAGQVVEAVGRSVLVLRRGG
jgi:isoamylase